MARKLEFTFNSVVVSLELIKVERSKLYGMSAVEAYDEAGEKCELMSLMNDGKTLFGEGGSSILTLTQDGEMVNRDELIALDFDSNPLSRFESSFNSPIPLVETATIDELLSANLKSVYGFSPSEEVDLLVENLRDGRIYKFLFSYRGSIVPDTSFLLTNFEQIPFMIVTNPCEIMMMGFQDSVELSEDIADELAVEELEFDMM